jgi:hypothetical protein
MLAHNACEVLPNGRKDFAMRAPRSVKVHKIWFVEFAERFHVSERFCVQINDLRRMRRKNEKNGIWNMEYGMEARAT